MLSNLEVDTSRYPDYGMLMTDQSEEWQFHYPALFFPHLVDENEHWKFYHCFNDEYPTKEELQRLKGLIIPGNIDSPLDDSKPYLVETKLLIKEIYENYKNIKLVGVCFGHQIISLALGGKVEKMKLDVPIVLGKHKSHMVGKVNQIEEFKAGFGDKYTDKHIYINRSHGFAVSLSPDGAQTLFKSDFGYYDLYIIEDRVLSMQAHPEFTDTFLIYQEVNKLFEDNYITKEYKEEVLKNILDPQLPDQGEQMLTMMRYFLKKEQYAKMGIKSQTLEYDSEDEVHLK